MTTQLMTPSFDSAKAESFAENLLALLNAGGLAVMISMGHRTRLFDTMAALPPICRNAMCESGSTP